MRTVIAAVPILREAFNTSLVTNRPLGRRISFLLLFKGGASSACPSQPS
jgi:hypothetical protein